jgi:putative Ca2+/H+ antiporter (TMEM165/GDT1 family)
LALFSTVFAAVLLAEVVGDKTLWTTTALAGAHRAGPVALGAAVAAALKMGVAVLLGGLLARLPEWVILLTSVVAWGGMAVALWRSARLAAVAPAPMPGLKLAGTSFAAVFLTEWADPGQLTAAVLAAQTGAASTVWAGAVAAMVVKIGAGLALTGVARRWVQPHTWRRGGAVAFAVFGVLALFSIH